MPAPTSITTEAFLELVHRHLTPVMAVRGYEYCGGGEGRTSVGPALLTRAHRWACVGWLRGRRSLRRQRPEPVLSAGFEGEGDDERWVAYYPARRHLDLSHLYAVGGGDLEAVTYEEIEGLLQATAVRIAEHGLGT